MKAVVIGFGSIGKRHARLLTQIGFDVTVVTKQSIDIFQSIKDINDIKNITAFDYIVIANESFLHLETLEKIHSMGYRQKVLIEKPLIVDRNIPIGNGNAKRSLPPQTQKSKFHIYFERFLTRRQRPFRISISDCYSAFCRDFSGCFIGYNLRFHPILQAIKKIIDVNAVQQVSIYTGQYLPSWRAHHRENTYSRFRAQQGGVLNDLSHELDYAIWLFGDVKKVTALGGRYATDITQDSDDAFSIIMQTDRAPLITIQLNYFDQQPTRDIILHVGTSTIRANLFLNEMTINGERKKFECHPDDTYLAEHNAILENNRRDLCDMNQAIALTQLMRQIEDANAKTKWITA